MLLCHLVMVCISPLNCRSGYVIPTILRTVSLTITSFIARHATDIFEAWKSFELYCNYLIEPCVSTENFYASVYGTSFDTGMFLHSYEPHILMSSAELLPHPGATQSAFTLDNFKSITLDGLWIAGFRSSAPWTGSDDGMAAF
jgi:hypothetical protein